MHAASAPSAPTVTAPRGSAIADPSVRRSLPPGLHPAAIGAVAGALLFVVAWRSILDDGHITMSYALNLAEHAHWGLTPFRSSNTATSPLNVWLLALGILITRSGTVAVGLVLVASTAATAGWLSTISRRVGLPPLVAPTVAVATVVTSPLFASTIGMETFLGIAVLTGVARYALDGRRVATGVLCGAAVLTRPDLAVPAAVIALGILVVGRLRPVRTAATIAAIVTATVLPWHLFSWIVLGGLVPDTYAIKSAAGQFAGGDTFFNGPAVHMIYMWTRAVLLTAVPVVVGLAALGWWARRANRARPPARPALVLALAGIAHWAAFAAVGVPPYHWYYCPAVGLLALAAALTIADLSTRRRLLLPATAIVIGVTAGAQLAGPIPWTYPAIYANWGSAEQYAAMARDVGRLVPPNSTVGSFGEIGDVAYYCRCDVIDPFSDRAAAQDLIATRYAKAGTIGRHLLDLNYLFNHDRDLPRTKLDYQLTWTEGPGPGWRVDGPQTGQGHIELHPVT